MPTVRMTESVLMHVCDNIILEYIIYVFVGQAIPTQLLGLLR